MSRLLRLIGVLLLSVVVLPLLAADDTDAKKKDAALKQKDATKSDENTPKKKSADKDKEPVAKEKKDKLTWGRELVGRIHVAGNSQREFTLNVSQIIMEPDYGAQQQYAQQRMQLAQHQLRMATARNLQDRNNAALQYYQTSMQMSQTQQRLLRPKEQKYDVKLRFAEGMKIRLSSPPLDYDDKGNPKKYTNKELSDLRGKEGLPGYAGEMDALKSGQTVKVYLARPPGAETAKGKAAKKKDDDEDDVPMSRPEAVMILVLRDPPPNQ
jgi:hypothetical protein